MGRHHKPSTTGRRIATITLAASAGPVVAGVLAAGTASAAQPTGILDEIERCESGGRNVPNASGESTASGYWQITDGTWASLGGSGSAMDHSRAEQRRMAEKLLASRGTQPWDASSSCHGQSARAGSQSPSRPERAQAPAPKVKPAPKAKVVEKKAEKAAPKARAVEQRATLPKVTPKAKPSVVVPAVARFTPGGTGTYTVQAGDTLSHLAAKHGTTVARLMEINRGVLEMPDWIFQGERINLR